MDNKILELKNDIFYVVRHKKSGKFLDYSDTWKHSIIAQYEKEKEESSKFTICYLRMDVKRITKL